MIINLQFTGAPVSLYIATINSKLGGYQAGTFYATSPTGASGSWAWQSDPFSSSAGGLVWFQKYNEDYYAFCVNGIYIQVGGTGGWEPLPGNIPANIVGGWISPTTGHMLLTTNLAGAEEGNNFGFTAPGGVSAGEFMGAVWQSSDKGVTWELLYEVDVGLAINAQHYTALWWGIIAPFSDQPIVIMDQVYEVNDTANGWEWGAANAAATAWAKPGTNDYFYANGLQGAPGAYFDSSGVAITENIIFAYNNILYGGATLAAAMAGAVPANTTQRQIPGPGYSVNPVQPWFNSNMQGFISGNVPAQVLSGANLSVTTTLGSAKSFVQTAYQTVSPGAILGIDGIGTCYYSATGSPALPSSGQAAFSVLMANVAFVLYVPPVTAGMFLAGGFVIVTTGNEVYFSQNGATRIGKSLLPFAPMSIAYNDGAIFIGGQNGKSAYSYDLVNWTSTASQTGPNDLVTAWGGKVT